MRKLLLLGTLALLSTSTACTPLDNVMVAIFGRSMRDQRSFDPYENTLLPPENSVPFAAGNLTAGPYDFNVGQPELGVSIPDFTAIEVAQNAPVVANLSNPVASDSTSLARGQVMYERVCAVCHGDAGIGAQAYIVDKHPILPAYNISGERVAAFSDGYIYGMIRLGRGLMPAYGHQVGNFDRWHIVNYVRELQRQAGTFPVSGGN
jgi:mono/diheme cytochrome c family protein